MGLAGGYEWAASFIPLLHPSFQCAHFRLRFGAERTGGVRGDGGAVSSGNILMLWPVRLLWQGSVPCFANDTPPGGASFFRAKPLN